MYDLDFYSVITDRFSGEVFDSYEQYERAVRSFIDEIAEDLGKAERWACQRRLDTLDEIGVAIKELEEE